MSRPCVLVMMTSTMTNEPRVRREAGSLIGAGCRVVALGTMVDGDEPRRDDIEGLEIRRFDLLDVRLVRALKRRRSGASGGSGSTDAADRSARVDLVGDAREVAHHMAALVGFLWHGWRARADVYHPHDPPPLLAALILGFLRRKPVVYESHEYWGAKHPDRPLSRWWTRLVERMAGRRADLVIVVNDSIADQMVADHGIDRPTPVLNVSRIPALPELPEHDRSAPLGVLYHGILVAGRGIEGVIDAVALTTHPVELVVRGSGPLRPALERRAESAGIADRCRFDDAVPPEELAIAAGESDVGVMFFEAELGYEFALPNKLFEYMAGGVAIVASDLPELRRMVEAHRLGLIVPPGDVEALADALDRLADDREALQEHRRRALAAATTSYNWESHQQRFLDAYEPFIPQRDHS